MALAVSYALVGAAIALLALYGADVAAAKASGEEGTGFLPFDHMARGLGLGLPSMALPVAAFFISRREPSRALGALLAAAGALIIVGGAVVLAMPAEHPDAGAADSAPAGGMGGGAEGMPEHSPAASAAPLLAAGSFIVALGAIKVRRS